MDPWFLHVCAYHVWIRGAGQGGEVITFTAKTLSRDNITEMAARRCFG